MEKRNKRSKRSKKLIWLSASILAITVAIGVARLRCGFVSPEYHVIDSWSAFEVLRNIEPSAPLLVISSYEELTTHFQPGAYEHLNVLSNRLENFSFNQDFFEHSYLVMFGISSATSLMLSMRVCGVRQNGTIVMRERIPLAFGRSAVMSGRVFLIEFDNSFQPEQFSVLWTFGLRFN